jgi:hypothetical protein
MGRAQMDRDMGKRVKIKNMANGGDVLVKDSKTCWTTKLGFIALMALVLSAMLIYPSNALALTEFLYPSAGISNNNAWTWTGGDTDYRNWQSSDGDTSYAVTTTVDTVQTVHVDNTSVGYGIIDSVTVRAECKGHVSTREKVSVAVVDGGVTSFDPSVADTDSYATYDQTWTTMPNQSGAWTWDDIDALEVGVSAEKQGGSYTGELRCTEVWAEVVYHFEIDNLTVGSNVGVATTAQGKQTDVKMQYVSVDVNTTGNSNAVITSIAVNDMGIAQAGDWANMHIYIDSDTDIGNGVLGTKTTSNWSGAFTTVDVTNMSTAARTVTNPTTKYIQIYYDLNESAGGTSLQSRVAAVNVLPPDERAANTWGSNSFPVTYIRDTLSAGTAVTPTATGTTANESETAVEMMYLPVDCSTPQDGKCVMTSVTVDDLGSAYNGDITGMYIYVDDDTNLANSVLGTTDAGAWSGAETVIDITGMTTSARTVTNPTTKYVWVVYDLNNDTGENSVQSSMTEIDVAWPDNKVSGVYNSTLINILHLDDQLSMTATKPVAVTVAAGDTGVLMQTITVECSSNADGNCEMTTVTVDDTGTAASGHWANLNVYVDEDDNLGNGTVSGTTIASWDGTSTVVDIADYTVTNADADYIHIEYDLTGAAILNTIRSKVTNIAVSGTTDLAATEIRRSNPITVQPTGNVDTVTTCADCHNMPVLDNDTAKVASSARGGSRAIGNHATVYGHMPDSPVAADCAVCHLDHGTNMNHRDGIVNMASLINSGTYSKGTSFVQNASDTMGTCNNTECHGIVSDMWGTNLGQYDTCTKCHGTKMANPATWQTAPGGGGVDTEGDTETTDPQVGAHYEHLAVPLNTAGGITAECETCHLKPATVFAAGHIDNGAPADMTYNDFVKNYGSLTPSRTGDVCNNTYCHGNNLPGGSPKAMGNAPGWLDSGYLTGTDMDHDCAQCHGFPPKNYSGEHEGMTTGAGKTAACDICHPILNDPVDDNESGWKLGNAFNDQKKHIDGKVDVTAACDGCHGYPPDANDGFPSPIDVEGKGVHESHVAHLEGAYTLTRDAESDLFGDYTVFRLCKTCHFESTHEQTGIDSGDTFRTVAFNAADYQFGTGAAVYNGQQGVIGATKPKTCKNNTCHYIMSPEWEAY